MPEKNKTVAVNGRTYQWPKQPVVAVCIDGSQPEYIEEAINWCHALTAKITA